MVELEAREIICQNYFIGICVSESRKIPGLHRRWKMSFLHITKYKHVMDNIVTLHKARLHIKEESM